MAHLSKIRLKNFRSFVDTGSINLFPINILVGKNSIGKSSFARVWPLLRQSIGINKRAPVLWLGNLVDMGAYKDVISSYSIDDYIEFEFVIEPNSGEEKNKKNLRDLKDLKDFKGNYFNEGAFELVVSIQLKKEKDLTFASKIKIENGGTIIELFMDSDELIKKMFVNGVSYNSRKDFRAFISNTYSVFPQVVFLKKIIMKDESIKYISVPSGFSDRLYKLINYICNEKITEEQFNLLERMLCFFGSAQENLDKLKLTADLLTPDWSDFVLGLTLDSREFVEIERLILASSISNLSNHISSVLSGHFSRVRYIEPIRATSERFYRHQELGVDEVDSKGSNLVFFIESLGSRLADLNQWLEEHLKINVEAEINGGHLSLVVKDLNTGRKNNIADMGFGFSQIIPIAVQIWKSANDKSKSFWDQQSSDTVVIEQPELHLHPAMQARIAEMIVSIIALSKINNVKIIFIIETHSQHLISRLGDLVVLNKIDKNEINILMFEQEDGKDTKINSSQFDNDGVLMNWPYGFFEADSK